MSGCATTELFDALTVSPRTKGCGRLVPWALFQWNVTLFPTTYALWMRESARPVQFFPLGVKEVWVPPLVVASPEMLFQEREPLESSTRQSRVVLELMNEPKYIVVV